MKALFGSRPELARVRRDGFARGIRVVAPLMIGTGIWGLVTGVAMVKVGLTTAQAIAMTLLVFSGTVQLASLPLIAADAPVYIVMLTAVVVNLRRHLLAGLHPFFRRFSIARRWLISYFMVDMSFAMFLSRFADAPQDQRGTTEQVWFFLGMSAGSWMVWQTMSIIGIVLAAGVPRRMGSRVHRHPCPDCDDPSDDRRQTRARWRRHCGRSCGAGSEPAAKARVAGRRRRRYRCRDGD